MSGPYTVEQLLNKIEAAPEIAAGMPIYHVGTAYAALGNSSYYRNCREETFGNLQAYDWGWPTPGVTVKPWGNELWSFYIYTGAGLATPNNDKSKDVATKLANISEVLAKVEKELKFKRHSFVIEKKWHYRVGTLPSSNDVYTVKTKGIFSSRWRYSPAMLFILLNLLRNGTKKNSFDYYMNLSTIKAIKKHGMKKIFGANMSVQRSKGRGYPTTQGIQYFQENELPKIITELEGPKEANKIIKTVST